VVPKKGIGHRACPGLASAASFARPDASQPATLSAANNLVMMELFAGAVLLGGAVHGRDVRGVRAQGGAVPHRCDRHHHADGAALELPRHRDRRHLQHDVRHLRRRNGLQSGRSPGSSCWFHFPPWLLAF
jgi:hypothetical protein